MVRDGSIPGMSRQRAASPPTPRELAHARRRMDRVNARLLHVLAARARVAAEIGDLKRRLKLPAADPRREREMLEALLRGAPSGFSRTALARILRTVFRESRALVRARTKR
jgi:chorismate mutase